MSNIYWERRPILSHNKIMNFVLSNRGGGKTYNMTQWAIDDYKKTGHMAVWVRRYQTEIDEVVKNDKYFDAIRSCYPKDELHIDGNIGYINKEPFIYFIALSTSRQLKSNNYPTVNKIIFDEFIIDKGRINYLKNEVEVFLDLYETIARTRDNVRAVLLANAVTVVNPYFLYWKMKPLPDRRFTVKGECCIEMYTNDEFVELKNKSRFGRLVSGTRYGDYAVNNNWLLDNDKFVEKRPEKTYFTLSLIYNGNEYGYWIDYENGLIYMSDKYDPSSRNRYCIQKEDHDANLLLIKSLKEYSGMKTILFAFQNGLLRFENMVIKNIFYEIIGYFIK